MAHLHFRRTAYKSGGSTAVQRVDYITRHTTKELSGAERNLQYIREGREDLVYERTRNLPSWAASARDFFTAAERYERVGGVAFEEWKITLPQELTHAQNMALMHDLVGAIAGEKLPVTYAFHDPRTLDDQRQQPHLHLLISARQNDAHTRKPAQHFKRWNAQHPERGGAQKDRAFAHMGGVKAHRVLISDIVNLHLERHGVEARVHPESLKEREIDRTPEPKLLPSESRTYRERGIISPRMQEVLDIRSARAQEMDREQESARHYWLARKQELGIATRYMSPDAKLERITKARMQRVHATPARLSLAQLRQEERTQGQRVRGLEGHVQDLVRERRREQRPGQRREGRQWKEELAAEQVLARGKEHGLPRDVEAERTAATLAQYLRSLSRGEEQQRGAGLRVRLHERERDDDRGLSW